MVPLIFIAKPHMVIGSPSLSRVWGRRPEAGAATGGDAWGPDLHLRA